MNATNPPYAVAVCIQTGKGDVGATIGGSWVVLKRKRTTTGRETPQTETGRETDIQWIRQS